MKLSKLVLALITLVSISVNGQVIKLTETSNQFVITSKSLSELLL